MRRVDDDDDDVDEEAACEVGVFRSVIGCPASARAREREKKIINIENNCMHELAAKHIECEREIYKWQRALQQLLITSLLRTTPGPE
jgi:hypothetical protein